MDVGRLAQQIAVIWGEGLRTVEEQLDPGVRKYGHPRGRGRQHRRDVVDIWWQRGEGERLGDSLGAVWHVHAPRLGDRLEPTDEQLADFLFEVAAAIRVSKHRHLRAEAVDGVGDDVEVLRGMEGYDRVNFGSKGSSPQAGGINDRVRPDLTGPAAVRERDSDRFAALGDDPFDFCMFADRDSSSTCSFGEGSRRVDRIGDAVAG